MKTPLKVTLYVFGGLFTLGIIGNSIDPKPRRMTAEMISDSIDRAAADSVESAQEAGRLAKIKLESDLTAARFKTERLVKNVLKDPDSYEAIDYKTWHIGEAGHHVGCALTYRAKNSFGGYAISKVRVLFNEALQPVTIRDESAEVQ